MTELEVQILITENALSSARQHTARTQRRLNEAQDTFNEACAAEVTLRREIERMRDVYLRSAM